MSGWLMFALGIFLFQLLVIIHEYGHFLVAKRNGVKVEEFGLGFPPRIAGKTMGKGIFRAYYSLNLLPIGGFVRLHGENDSAKGEGTYGGSRLWVKAKIIIAGIFMNYLVAVLLFTVLALIGIPRLLPAEPLVQEEQFTIASDTKVIDSRAITAYIDKGSPADLAGLKLGDHIVKIGKIEIANDEELGLTTPQFAGQTTDVLIKRGDQELVLAVNFNSQEDVDRSKQEYETCRQNNQEECQLPIGYIGVISNDFVVWQNTWSAPITGVALSYQYAKVTLQVIGSAIGDLFAGDTESATQAVGGPVAIVVVLREGANLGIRFLLMMIAIISLTLAIMNALPIPALDGGRLALTILFRKILRRPLVKRTEERIVGTSMAALLLLMALITIVDINRFL